MTTPTNTSDKPVNPRPDPDVVRYRVTGPPPTGAPGVARVEAASAPRGADRSGGLGPDGTVGPPAEARPWRRAEPKAEGHREGIPTPAAGAAAHVGRPRVVEPRVDEPRAAESRVTPTLRDGAEKVSGPRRSEGAPPAPTAPMVRPRTPRPRSGWQSVAYRVTGGRWNPGPGERERREREREAQIATQLRGKHVTAFFCLKGGISKTSTTAATSIALADLRPDPVFAIDANPDAGDLAERLVGDKLSGIAALARDVDSIDSLEALGRYTATRGRLTVLPGEPNPTLGDSLRAADFDAVVQVVQRYYSFVQVDCGTGVTHPLMEGVLRYADTVVIPAAWSVTGAKRAAETIEWLRENGFPHLAETCIVVLTAKDIVSGAVDKDAVLDYLSRAGDVIIVPADPHVADGALLDWDSLQPATREAYLDIAAAITRRFDSRRGA